MKDQITAAVLFLSRLIGNAGNLNEKQLEIFKDRLCELLIDKFSNHWFPEKPCRGQGYRCIRVNETERKDPLLEQAALESGIKYEDLKMPVEITIWVDPNEVCCRFGEHEGSFYTVASFNEDIKETYSINIEELKQKSERKSKKSNGQFKYRSSPQWIPKVRQYRANTSYTARDANKQAAMGLRSSPFQYEGSGSVTPPYSPVKHLGSSPKQDRYHGIIGSSPRQDRYRWMIGSSPRQDRYHWVNRSLIKAK